MIPGDPSLVDLPSKKEARSLARRRVAAMTSLDRAGADSIIRRRLCEIVSGQPAGFVAGYVSLSDEVCIDAFLCEAVARDLTVFLPYAERGTLRFAPWVPSSTLRRDGEGVLAPRCGDATALPSGAGVIVVPGRAFDAAGGRIGRGRGYYDRALMAVRPGQLVVGVGYECQLLDRVPREEWDRPVQRIITEARDRVTIPTPGN